jgi:hypothetical protein
MLRCETLEAREVPAANLMGVNLSGVEDWSYDRMFADAMKSARRPSRLGSHEGTPPIDSKGWPASDASIVVWNGIDRMNGTYKLSFTGQANVSTLWGVTTIRNKVYSAATNTTTADIVYHTTENWGLLLNFANTKRTAGSASNTGITNIKLMRPLTPGSAVSYSPSVTFTQPLKDLVSRFSVVRMMDNTGSNGANNLNGIWSNRRPADYASQAATGAARGMAWEYAVQFWNETDKDAWVNIPFPADDQYVLQLANLLKNNLEAGRKIYLEYSNELWNTWGPFPGDENREAAVAEVIANPSSPLNFDGIYPSRDSGGWELAKRRIALRSVQVSNIFRQVFGDSAMMSRVRPVMMSQLGYASGWLAGELDYIEDYFNNPTYQTAPRPISYYLYGAGGSAYQDPNWSLGTGITVDQIFATMPYNFDTAVKQDLDWVASFGLKRIAYEGGPNLDNIVNNRDVPTATLEAAWADPRMQAEVVQNHNAWSAAGGELLMYFASTGGCQWGLARDPFDLNTPKIRAINELNANTAVAANYGKLAPLDLVRDDFRIPYGQGNISDMRATSLTQNWNGSIFRVTSAGNYTVRLTSTASAGGRVEISIDGRSIGIVDIPSNGVTAPISLGSLAIGQHGIVLRARAGTFGISKVSISVQTSGPPAAPGNLSASAISSSSIRVTWADNSSNETGFLLQRATNAAFTTGLLSLSLASNTSEYVDFALTAGATYYYHVRSANAVGNSIFSNMANATTTGGNGLSARLFDNQDFTGTTLDRTDAAVDFQWADVPASGFGADTFSVRWLGRVQAIESGAYVFRTLTDDGVRLWVDGRLVVNNWTDHAATYNTTVAINLTAGQRYEIRMEYYEQSGGAVAKLEWKRPEQTAFVVVPQLQLYPNMGGPVLFADSFDSGLGTWNVAKGRWEAASLIAGRRTVNASVGGTAEEISLAATTSWTNSSVAAWVNLANPSGSLSLLGRVSDSTHYYLLSLRRNSSGQSSWFLESRDGSTWSTLASGTITYAAGTWVRLRLTMNGTTLRAESSADGNTFATLGTATNGRYASGRIGFRATNSPAYFDDAVVTGI